MLLVLLKDLVDVTSNTPQVTVLNVRVHVKHRLHVVVIDVLDALVSLDGGQVAQELHVVGWASDGSALQRANRVHFVLRRLNRDRVAHPVLGIEPEVRAGLSTGT